jgi:uncharacterized protein YdhG (YjbR/CyaY superfamily)
MTDIDTYLARIEDYQRDEFERVRKIVKREVPEAEETISYGIPTFTYKGKYLLYFGAFKKHMSLFPGSYLIDELADELKDFKMSKGTIQYSKDMVVPESVIKKLITMRKGELDKH